MKKILSLFAVITLTAINLYAQKNTAEGTKKTDLPIVYLNNEISIHFISPEPIQYVDISSKKIIGDLPVKNVLRIKYLDTLKQKSFNYTDDAVITIVGEKFMAQYNVIYDPTASEGSLRTNIEILPADIKPLDVPNITMSEREMKNYALSIIRTKPNIHSVNSQAYGIQAELNNVYTLGDFVFLDISYTNRTNLKYDIDELRFKVDDKKVTKASNIQSVEIKPELKLFDAQSFKKYYRNVYVFKKFTFPGNKVLNVELSEKQLSGRIISFQIDYSDILSADMLKSN
ncbi:conjugative transposon protein TraN [Pedobacter polaris]|uniref:Conjugative transposon protein TraN n=1 Tax=Pedobacter polaris TaxID=2571273 RepID=A0A4U1CLE3_9SPHI|nr:conjugative transposon protein TraN [Pedobacter polaris]TKC08026.1 conjugative transposon protein TraN [Pedobacter polaris]